MYRIGVNQPLDLKFLRNKSQRNCETSSSSDYQGKQANDSDMFSFSDVDMKMFNLEKEIEEYEIAIKTPQENI